MCLCFLMRIHFQLLVFNFKKYLSWYLKRAFITIDNLHCFTTTNLPQEQKAAGVSSQMKHNPHTIPVLLAPGSFVRKLEDITLMWLLPV